MHSYNIPVIQPDLRHEETIIQAANAFEHLQNIITNVFDKIEARIDANNNKIKEIKCRICVANKKIESLFGTNKAITVFSPSKYPAASLFEDIPMTFTYKNTKPLTINREYEVLSNLDSVSHKNIQDKLLFYHVQTSGKTKSNLNNSIYCEEGLGQPPSNIESINAFLLFNKPINPYVNYKKIENSIRGEKLLLNESEQCSSSKMEAAPVSISNRKLGNKKPNESLFYAPGLNEAPAMDVPVDLPDLPGIADDVTYNFTDTEHAIAPSTATSHLALPDLPDILYEEHTKNHSSEEVLKIDVIKISSKNDSNSVQNISTTSLMVAPPPPPPPPLPSAEQNDNEKEHVATTISKQPNENLARSNLMEAIRHAGGLGKAKLRAADQESASKPKSEKNSNVSTSGNLMADLHNKLALRRKGISGLKEMTNAPNVMDRLSAMIPPPPKPQVNSSNNEASEDDDWE